MPDSRDKQLDRYLAGELSGPEQRDLAQASLDEPELFDTLTAAAVVKATVLRDRSPKSAPAVAPPRRLVTRWRALTLTGVVAAAAVLALVMVYRSSSRSVSPPKTTSLAPSTPSSGGSAAAADSTTLATPPLMLTARLDELARRSTSEFRGVESYSRTPKSDGLVVSVDEGEVTVDLGSLDGLTKGAELQVFRGREDAKAVGRLRLATVFRERSRGRAASADALAP